MKYLTVRLSSEILPVFISNTFAPFKIHSSLVNYSTASYSIDKHSHSITSPVLKHLSIIFFALFLFSRKCLPDNYQLKPYLVPLLARLPLIVACTRTPASRLLWNQTAIQWLLAQPRYLAPSLPIAAHSAECITAMHLLACLRRMP